MQRDCSTPDGGPEPCVGAWFRERVVDGGFGHTTRSRSAGLSFGDCGAGGRFRLPPTFFKELVVDGPGQFFLACDSPKPRIVVRAGGTLEGDYRRVPETRAGVALEAERRAIPPTPSPFGWIRERRIAVSLGVSIILGGALVALRHHRKSGPGVRQGGRRA